MKLKTIRASAGCTIPHPHQQYSNFKLFVELTAELGPRDEHQKATAELQDTVNTLLATERARRITDIEIEYQQEQERRRLEREKQRAIHAAEEKIRTAQHDLAVLKGEEEPDPIPF